jgi:hypothetical protein
MPTERPLAMAKQFNIIISFRHQASRNTDAWFARARGKRKLGRRHALSFIPA